MRKHVFAALLTAALTVAAGFAAFAGEEGTEIPSVGSDASGQNFGCVIENGTETEITGLALRVNYGDFSENLLEESGAIAAGEKVHFYCTPGEMVNYVPAVYDIEVTFADDTKGVLHTLPMGDADEMTILTGTMEAEAGEDAAEAEDVAEGETEAEAAEAPQVITYIRFTSLSLGYEMDTLRKETEISGLGEGFLKADYESKITYTGGGSWDGGGSTGGSGDGGGNSGGGDGCLTGGVLF